MISDDYRREHDRYGLAVTEYADLNAGSSVCSA